MCDDGVNHLERSTAKVYESLRQGQGATAELDAGTKPKRARKASAPATDDQLNADLDRLLPSM